MDLMAAESLFVTHKGLKSHPRILYVTEEKESGSLRPVSQCSDRKAFVVLHFKVSCYSFFLMYALGSMLTYRYSIHFKKLYFGLKNGAKWCLVACASILLHTRTPKLTHESCCLSPHLSH